MVETSVKGPRKDQWSRGVAATSFDAEGAPGHIGRVCDAVTVYPWDAPLVTLPDAAAIRDCLITRQGPTNLADTLVRTFVGPTG